LVISIGIIGYRNHAQHLITLVETHSKCKLEHIFHPNKKIDDDRGTNNFSDLFACDAIIIASPNNTHVYYIEKLKKFKGYIFCEKPPAVSMKEFNQIKKIGKNRRERIFFNFNYRFSELSNLIKKINNSGQIGKILNIDIKSTHGLAYQKKYLNSWRADGRNNKHNILETLSIHYIDLILLHFGKSEKIFYFPKIISKNGTSFDTSFLVMDFHKGPTVSLFNSYATCYSNEIIIFGSKGIVEIKNNKEIILKPRNTFDKKGRFKRPPIFKQEKLSLEQDYSTSLEKSVKFFLNLVKEKQRVQLSQYKNSLLTNELILKIKK